jgi:hypothetical protein
MAQDDASMLRKLNLLEVREGAMWGSIAAGNRARG